MTEKVVDAVRKRAKTLQRCAVERTPASVKRRLVRPYNYFQVHRANRAFGDREVVGAVTPTADAPDHVVLVVVDALRADVLSEDVSPYLQSRRQANLVTTAPWTFPAVTSLVTGTYPHEHGAIRQSDTPGREAESLAVPPKLSTDTPTLVDVFANAGYRTYGAFAFHMPFFALSGLFENHRLYDDATVERLVSDFEGWLGGTEERTFSYLHLGDLHEPVGPPEAFCRRHDVDTSIPAITRWAYETSAEETPEAEAYRTHRWRLYEAAVEYVDTALEGLAGRLREKYGANVAVLVTGDHGEAFWEHTRLDAAHFVDSRPAHCVDHGGTPYESIARVPLVTDGFSLPAVGRQRASLVDIAPTLTDLLGHPDALDVTGRSLMAPIEDRALLVESARYGHEKKAVYVGRYKGIFSRGDGEAMFFELPEEHQVQPPEPIEDRMYRTLPPWPSGDESGESISGVAQSRLEALGYV